MSNVSFLLASEHVGLLGECWLSLVLLHKHDGLTPRSVVDGVGWQVRHEPDLPG